MKKERTDCVRLPISHLCGIEQTRQEEKEEKKTIFYSHHVS